MTIFTWIYFIIIGNTIHYIVQFIKESNCEYAPKNSADITDVKI